MAYNGRVVEEVFCPLVDEMIRNIDCLETSDVIRGMFKPSCLFERFAKKPDYEKICKSCKWYNY